MKRRTTVSGIHAYHHDESNNISLPMYELSASSESSSSSSSSSSHTWDWSPPKHQRRVFTSSNVAVIRELATATQLGSSQSRCCDMGDNSDNKDENYIDELVVDPSMIESLSGATRPTTALVVSGNQSSWIRSLSLAALLVVTFGMGSCSERYFMMTSRLIFNNAAAPLSEANKLRDELLVDQEKLLADNTRKKANWALLNKFEQRHPGKVIPAGAATNEQVDAAEIVALSHHLDLLQKEIAGKTLALAEQEKKRTEAETSAQQAWASYDLYSSQITLEQNQMNQDLSRLFKNMALEQFGIGPHHVEMQLKLPSEEYVFITIEMASVLIMPTSVYFFLQQVKAGLWDNVAFQFNEEHILLTDPSAKPEPPNGGKTNALAAFLSTEEKKSYLDKMLDQGLGHLPFSEYSVSQPHVEYTLGFSAATGLKQRPGPAFYINKVDNTENHKGEPCFGYIVIGREVVDRIAQMKGPVDDPFYIQPVRIVSAHILAKLDDAVGGLDHLESEQKKLQMSEI